MLCWRAQQWMSATGAGGARTGRRHIVGRQNESLRKIFPRYSLGTQLVRWWEWGRCWQCMKEISIRPHCCCSCWYAGGSIGAYGALSSGYQSLAARQAGTSVISASLFGCYFGGNSRSSFLPELACARQTVCRCCYCCCSQYLSYYNNNCFACAPRRDVRCAAGQHASKRSH